MTDLISFIVRLPTQPAKRDEMRSKLFAVLDRMAQEPDFINTWVHEDVNAPDTLVLYETWACSQAYFVSHHLTQPYRQDYEAALPGLLSKDRSIEFLKPIRTVSAN